ncbi:MAG: HepT-like ribonuclease domain-containing protein [Candidatus Auribacterota bacterium]
MMVDLNEKIPLLKKYFEDRQSIVMAYIFGSYAKDRNMSESDMDIAVYFKPQDSRIIEYEADKKYPDEDKIWEDVEDIVGMYCDFVVMNRCPATLALEILQTGKEIIVKNEGLRLEFYLRVSSVAEDFMEFAKDFYDIKQRSRSLRKLDKLSLRRRVDFLKDQFTLLSDFKNINFKIYSDDALKQLSIERLIENIVNASIDIAKIILASEKKRIPEKYQETLLLFGFFISFDEEVAKKFARYAELRNILAHEYLDIRFERIKNFIETAEPIYNKVIDFVNKLL